MIRPAPRALTLPLRCVNSASLAPLGTIMPERDGGGHSRAGNSGHGGPKAQRALTRLSVLLLFHSAVMRWAMAADAHRRAAYQSPRPRRKHPWAVVTWGDLSSRRGFMGLPTADTADQAAG